MALGGGAEYIPPGPSVRPGVGPQRGQPASTPGRPGQGNRGRGPGRGPAKGPPNRGPSKPPTRPAAAAQALGAPRAKTPFYGGEIPNIGGLASRLQLQQVGAPLHAAEEGEKASVRLPFQQKNSEIVNTEGNVRKSLEGINEGNKTYLQGLLEGAEGSAKTANNYAAESALSAQKNVETAGQNAQTNVAGQYAGNVAATQQRGEANVQAMRTLAAAAVAQGQQGLQAAQSRFGTEASRNRAAENQALEKVTARGKNARLEAGQKLYTDLLGLKTLEQRGALGEAKNKLTAAGLNIKASATASENARRAAQTAQGERKLNIDVAELNRKWTETGNKAAQNAAHDQYLNASLADKQAISNANIKYKEESLKQKAEANWIKAHGTGAAKPQQQEKFRQAFGKALNAFEENWASGKYNPAAVRTGLGLGYTETTIGKRPTKIPIGRVTEPLAIKVAEEVIAKHHISPQTKVALEAAGLPGSGWSEYLKRGR